VRQIILVNLAAKAKVTYLDRKFFCGQVHRFDFFSFDFVLETVKMNQYVI
jgi:hypothetical protein